MTTHKFGVVEGDITTSGCIICNNVGTYTNGYPQVHLGQLTMNAHRYVYQLLHGKIPPRLDVMHSCDNRECVNPAHLCLGTRKQNMADAVAKGRVPRGQLSGMSKVTEASVREIRELASNRVPQRRIALRYDISQAAVWKILNGLTWRWLQ